MEGPSLWREKNLEPEGAAVCVGGGGGSSSVDARLLRGWSGENPPKVYVTGSMEVRWAEGEKGPHRSLGKALVGGEELWGRVWSYAREPQGGSDLQASFSRPLGSMMVNHQKQSCARWGRHFSPLSWDAFEDYSYSLLLYGC